MINKKNLKKYFKIEYEGKFLKLMSPRAQNFIRINKKFELDEDVATLAGLMPDGSLIKDLRRIYFGQKKDIRKVYLFKKLIIKLFRPNNKIFIRQGCNVLEAYTNSKTLAIFYHKILEIPKSDQQMRVPPWIFKSSKKVKIAYLKQAFDMEGTILKRLYEIRFITKDKKFAFDLKRLLLQLNITSFVNERIGGTHKTIQYRLSIYSKANFIKFKEIGFSVPFNKKRFENLVKKYKI